MSRTGSRAHVRFARAMHMAVITALVAVMVPIGVPTASAAGVTYWVDAVNGVDTAPGTEALPFKTITAAVALADPTDTIMVKPGTYAAPLESLPILLQGETLKSTNGPAFTIIQGNGAQELLAITGWDDGDSLEGFTIRDGGNPSIAAVEVQLTAATDAETAPMISGCEFTSNDGGNLGGALYVYANPGTDLMVINNTFATNSAANGGAIRASVYGELYLGSNQLFGNVATQGGALNLYTGTGGYVVVEQNLMQGNTASSTGGAIWWQSGTPTWHLMRENTIVENVAAVGGALYLNAVTLNMEGNDCESNAAGAGGQAGFAYLENCDVLSESNYIANSSAGNLGSAWTVDPSSTLTELNDTVVNNSGSSYATYADAASTLAVVNCIYWNPTTPVEMSHADNLQYSCSSDDLATLTGAGSTVGLGMVYADPLLDSADLPALLDTSPCIDAGSQYDWAAFDYFGTTRPQGPAPDIGAYEMPQSAPLSVWRFFRPSTGTHFYTADEAEMLNVRNTLGGVYAFEGVSYTLNQWNNATPLYRFFRPSTGTHFYTADYAEMMNIRNTLGGIYAFEGVSYNVSSDDGGGLKPAVYRFFKPSSGTHFYTADAAERDNVIANLSHIYQYEGPAFWVGQ